MASPALREWRLHNWRSLVTLRPTEFAAITGLSLRTVRAKITCGEIESWLEGGCRIIPVRAALRFSGEPVDESTETPKDSPARRKAAEIINRIEREIR